MRTNKGPQKGQGRVHAFLGEETARPLVDWLNSGRDKLGGVAELVEIEEQYRQAKDPLVRSVKKAQAQALLADYRFAPIIDSMDEPWKVEWHDAGQGRSGRATAMLLFLDLKEQGGSLGRCEKPDCRKFFFKRFEHQRFCSDACRIAVLAADPRRKEQRKEYMRQLRRRKKLRQKKGGK